MADEDLPTGQSSLLASSAVMAAGTAVSRITGYVRSALLAAALGIGLHADVFNIANTIPTSLYILLAGGVFNAVLVPQLVRAMRNDEDRGVGYTNRIVTLAAVFLFAATVVLVIAAPLVMRLLVPSFFDVGFGAQRDSAIAFARYCLPQVFFYGMFVLVGQVLNARGSFGPMMWAPIANNVVAVSVLVIYLVSFGPAKDLLGGYTPRQELLLGAGSTLGIITQFLILVPFVRATGYRFRPAWDFRGSGLGHTLRLGMWTVGFVMVNQVAYFAIVRIASRGATAAAAQGEVIAAYTVYANASALVLVPHAIATVSLGTAMLPRISSLASQGDLAGARQEIARVLRIALSLVVPVVLLLPVISPAVADIVWGYAAASGYSSAYASTMVSFAPALLFFTVHYLMLRGFYALERNRTVFWVQCVIAVVNVVLAVALTTRASDGGVADALSLAYGGAYLIGSVTSYLLLRRTLSGLETRRLASFAVRIIALGAVAAVAAWGVSELFLALVPWTDKLATLARLMLVGGTDIALLLIGARLVGPSEIVDMEHLVRTRVRRGRHG